MVSGAWSGGGKGAVTRFAGSPANSQQNMTLGKKINRGMNQLFDVPDLSQCSTNNSRQGYCHDRAIVMTGLLSQQSYCHDKAIVMTTCRTSGKHRDNIPLT